MKWGVHRAISAATGSSDSTSRYRTERKAGLTPQAARKKVEVENLSRAKDRFGKASDIAKEGKNIVANLPKKAVKNDAKNMSDDELRTAVSRLNLEQNYSRLTSTSVSRGRGYALNILEIAGSTLAIASSAAALALTIRQLKG